MITSTMRELIYKKIYEKAERRIVGETVTTDDVVVEIGAGLGLISTLCALAIGGDRVHTYEANPELEPLIRETYSLNGVGANLVMACVGRGQGVQTFHLEDAFFSSSVIRRTAEARAVAVPRWDFKEVLSTVRPTFLIVDVEGFEEELLEGVQLDGVRKICIELHPNVIGMAACSRVISALLSQNFVLDLDLSEQHVKLFVRN